MQIKLTSLTVAAGLALAANAYAQTSTTGPSTASTPYGVGLQSYIRMYSIATVDNTGATADDSFNRIGGGTYSMAGIPDGLGALDNLNGTFSVFMNHELTSTQGVARDHGSIGAFVSKWNIDKNSLAVLSAGDLIQSVNTWNTTTSSYVAGTTVFNRFCSADLASSTAYFNSGSGLGTAERLFLNGEENGNEGRAFAHIVTGANAGTSYELPRLGKFSWENALASPFAQDKTIVIGTDDSTPGQVYMYVGTKQASGNEIERAGLTNGSLYGMQITGTTTEPRTGGLGDTVTSAAFGFFNHGDVANTTGAALNTASNSNSVTNFLRPEDEAWDTLSNNKFYFVTTDQYDQVKDGVGATIGRSRLWSMTFTDITQPELGGNLQVLLDGTEQGQMFDNITVDMDGNVLIVEDVGGQAHNGKLWSYNPANDSLTMLAKHDPARFGDVGQSVTTPFNNDEEFSGIIDITSMMQGSTLYDPVSANRWYAMVDQAHYTTGITAAQVQGGQFMIFSTPEPSRALFGMMGLGALLFRRRRA